MTFSKLDEGITKSSIWFEALHVRVVWIAFLAEKDENGFVAASRKGMIRVCNVTPEQFDEAEKILSSPDEDSRTKDFQGRRIEKIEGGWVVLNHEKYRLSESIKKEKRSEYMKSYMRDKRSVNSVNVNNVNSELTPVNSELTSVSVCVSESVSASSSVSEDKRDSKERKDLKTPLELAFDEFRVMRKKIKKPMTERAEELIWIELDKLAGDDEALKIAIIEQSIKSGWQDVYPLKDKAQNQYGKKVVTTKEIQSNLFSLSERME